MYIRTLHLEMFRSFPSTDLSFRSPTETDRDPALLPNVTLLLGNNGAGKTTILRGIALAVLAPVLQSSGFVAASLVRRAPDNPMGRALVRADLALHWQDLGDKKPTDRVDETALAVEIQLHGDAEVVMPTHAPSPQFYNEMLAERSPAFLVVGYSATRRVEPGTSFDSSLRSKSRLLRYQRVAGLFEEAVTLTPLATWLPEYASENPGRYKQVVDLLRALLPDECEFVGELQQREYMFTVRDVKLPFSALADGYRAYIGWIGDLLYHVCMGCPNGVKLVENSGIVLVDEIDLHLHPEWQRTIVSTLSATLPKLQFIISSHSPIVAGTMEPTNIIVLETDEHGVTTARRSTEPVYGLNADQVLVSSYFGLDTTRAPGAVDELRQLAFQVEKGDRNAAADFVRRLNGELIARESRGVSDGPSLTTSPPTAIDQSLVRRQMLKARPVVKLVLPKKGTTKAAAKKAAGPKGIRSGKSAKASSKRKGR